MGTFLHFSDPSLSRLNNAEYATFIARYLALLPLAEEPGGNDDKPGELSLQSNEQLGAPSLSIPADMVAQMNTWLATLTDLNKETRSSIETEDIAKTDADRDRLATFIVNHVAGYSVLPLESEQKAGKLLHNTLKVYTGIAQLPVAQETAAIKGLLLDLRKPEFAEAVETLKLTVYMDELERLNNLYEAQVAARSAARSERSIGMNSREVRREMDSLYTDMNDLAFASNLLHGTDETSAFIRNVNTLIAETRTARNQRGSQKKDDGESETDGKTDDERPGELSLD